MSKNELLSDTQIRSPDHFKYAGDFLETEKITDIYSNRESSAFAASSSSSLNPPITEAVKPWMARVDRKLVSGHAGDYGIQKIWSEGIRGQGVKVGVNDDGMVLGHVDFDYDKVDDNGYLFIQTSQGNSASAFYRHGTPVAGVIGAKANGVGVVGIAHESELWSADFTRFEFVTPAIGVGCDVVNNSWGIPETVMAHQFLSRLAYSNEFNKAAEGRDGLGMSLVYSAGNYRTKLADTAVHVNTNHENVIAVAAVDINTEMTIFSTPGETVHVSALGRSCVMIDADDLSGSSLLLGSGTSYAAPFVTGIVALMYQANAGLGLRDVQEILAYSAILPTPGMATFTMNSGTHSNGGGLHFSRDYGFGLVNAHGAVRLAQTWLIGGVQAETAHNRERNEIRPYRMFNADSQHSSLQFRVAEHSKTEHVKLRLDIDVSAINDLKVVLRSPSGTESVLMNNYSKQTSAFNSIIDLGSRRFWGEDSAGDWTLSVSSARSLNVLRSAELILSGDGDTQNDRYVYTDEFGVLAAADANRLTLRDTDGGNNTFNASSITGNAVIDQVKCNHLNVIAVAAVDIDTRVSDFSTPGEAVHVSALGVSNIMANADDLTGVSLDVDSGTSFSAPFVSGVVALMYQANAGLGLRDVQEILAYSARLPQGGTDGFGVNRNTQANGGGLYFSRDYGFGLVNAHHAVRLAQSWFVGGESAKKAAKTAANRALSEINTFHLVGDDGHQFTLTFSMAEARDVEHVKLRLDLDAENIRDLRIVLTSPQGTESVLMDDYGNRSSAFSDVIDLGSRRFWGEPAAGEWSVNVTSTHSLNDLRSAALILSGDSQTQNDRYVYTDEFNALAVVDPMRLLLDDRDGGDDTNRAGR